MIITHASQENWNDTGQTGVIQPSAVIAMEHVVMPEAGDLGGRNVLTELTIDRGWVEIDASLGDYFLLPFSGEITEWVVYNVPEVCTLRVRIVSADALDTYPQILTWPVNFTWPDGTVPTLEGFEVERDLRKFALLTLITFDGGGSWRAELEKTQLDDSGVLDPLWTSATMVVVNGNMDYMNWPFTAVGQIYSDNFIDGHRAYDALVFDGASYIEFDQSNSIDLSGDFTLEAFVWLEEPTGTGADTGYPLFSKPVGSGSPAVNFYIEPSGRVVLDEYDEDYNNWQSASITYFQQFGELVHVELSRYLGIVSFSINGEPYGVSGTSGLELPSGPMTIRLGMIYDQFGGASYLKGRVAAFRATVGACRYQYSAPFTRPGFPFPGA
jgi:hypothetical protein